MTGAVFESGKSCKNCDSGTVLTAYGSYLRKWTNEIQIGGEGGFRLLSRENSASGNSETLLDLAAVGAYNFSSDFANSIFVKAGVGIFAIPKENLNGYESAVGLFVGAGKRFQWLNNVAYTPELRLVKKGDIDMGVQIHILNFSIMW